MSASERDVLGELLTLLRLERIEEDLFRGQSQDLGWGRVFGGQVLGQALSAAAQTVPSERAVHSLHAYFLRVGDVSRPIVYEVDRIRDGGSFTTRRVVAIQKGKAIFNLSASFQKAEEGLDHQDEVPEARTPDALRSERELAKLVADQLPPSLREQVTGPRPIQIKPVTIINPLAPRVRPPQRQVWMRAAGPLPDDQAIHQYLLAYASDFHFLATALQPHGRSWLSRDLQVASLDHALWFHRPLRFDDWLLYDVHSPSAFGSRGIAQGRYFDREGRLVATVVQEGLMRRRATPPV